MTPSVEPTGQKGPLQEKTGATTEGEGVVRSVEKRPHPRLDKAWTDTVTEPVCVKRWGFPSVATRRVHVLRVCSFSEQVTPHSLSLGQVGHTVTPFRVERLSLLSVKGDCSGEDP